MYGARRRPNFAYEAAVDKDPAVSEYRREIEKGRRAGLFQVGRDFKPVNTAHKWTLQEKERMQEFEGLDYHEAISKACPGPTPPGLGLFSHDEAGSCPLPPPVPVVDGPPLGRSLQPGAHSLVIACSFSLSLLYFAHTHYPAAIVFNAAQVYQHHLERKQPWQPLAEPTTGLFALVCGWGWVEGSLPAGGWAGLDVVRKVGAHGVCGAHRRRDRLRAEAVH